MNSETIDIASNFTKLKYETITNYDKEKEIFVYNDKQKYIILLDISYILHMIERIDKLDDDWNDSELSDEEKMRLSYSILNVASHYRHYVYKNIRSQSIIVLFASDKRHYDKFKNTFRTICDFTKLIKKSIFIEKLDSPNSFIYFHMAYFVSLDIFNVNSNINKKCRVIYIGNNLLFTQFLRIDIDMVHIKNNNINSGLDVFYDADKIHYKKNKIENRKTSLISFMIALLGFKHGFDKLPSLVGKKIQLIYDKLNEHDGEFIDKDSPFFAISSLDITEEEYKIFNSRLRMIDPDFHMETFKLAKKLIKTWSSKLETKAIHSINDIIEFHDLKLNIQWLIET